MNYTDQDFFYLHQAAFVNAEFKKIFNTSFEYFIDKLSIQLNRIHIDVFKFDEFLKKLYKDEYSDELSLSDFIINKFGGTAHLFISKLI